MKERPEIARRVLSQTDLEKALRDFESTYRMSSQDFYIQYNWGALGDSRDFVIWAGYYIMAVRSGLRNLEPA